MSTISLIRMVSDAIIIIIISLRRASALTNLLLRIYIGIIDFHPEMPNVLMVNGFR